MPANWRHDRTSQTLNAHTADRIGSLSLALTPLGHLRLVADAEAPPLAADLADRLAAIVQSASMQPRGERQRLPTIASAKNDVAAT